MSPRSGSRRPGQDWRPWMNEMAETPGIQDPIADSGLGPTRHNWQMPAGLPMSGGSTPERTISFSTTILDSIIPFVYGERKVTGLCAGRNLTGQICYMAFIFAFGKQDSITDLEINGETASGLPWIQNINYRYGTGAETIPAGYTSFGTNDDWAKYAYVCFQVNTLLADVPGSFDVTAVLGGQHVYDWRTDTTDVYANPALIAYDIITSSNWRGLSATKIDADQWEPFADWCDDTMGDSSARFAFNGAIYQRDPEAAVAEVLGHAFGSLYFGVDGKLKIWSEMDPPAITGEWSASASATITEDSTVGEATTEVEVGDILYVGTNVRTVTEVTDDDTIVLDSALTVSGVTVRKTSGIYLRKENLVRLPTGRNIAPNTIPDEVIVSHTQSNDWGSYRYPAPGDVTGDKRLEITANGCTNASQARRMSEMKKNLMTLQPFFWDFVADGAAAGLEPGDVFFFDDDLLTMQPARALPPVEWLTDGTYSIKSREYDPAAASTNTEADDTPPSVTPGWATDDPDAPTAAVQIFGEAGYWDASSLVPDPDDLETDWSDAAGISGSYSAVNDWTVFTVSTPATATSDYAIGGKTRVVVTGLFKTDADGFFFQLIDTGASATKANVAIPSDNTWHRVTFVCDCGATSNSIRISGLGASATETLTARRVRCVDWNSDPSLSLYERWTWTEHGSASSSVALYRMTDDQNLGMILAETPQGSTALEHNILVVGVSGATTQWGTGATVEAAMYAVGPHGGYTAFPTPTQQIESRPLTMPLDSMRDVDLIQSARIGDITNGDYVDIDTSGHMTLVGDATVWDDEKVTVSAAGRLGFSDPDWVKWADNGSGSTGVYVLGFDDTTEEEVFFDLQTPHGWKEGTNLVFHVHWGPLVAPEGAAGVTWGLELSWANVGKVDGVGSVVTFGNSTIVTTSDTDTSFQAKEHRMVTFSATNGTGKTISSIIVARLFRDVDDADDDYTGDACYLSSDAHIEKDSMGSNTVDSKT